MPTLGANVSNRKMLKKKFLNKLLTQLDCWSFFQFSSGQQGLGYY